MTSAQPNPIIVLAFADPDPILWAPAGHKSAAPPMTAMPQTIAKAPDLVDPFGRGITYLRVSVTDRCDLRCLYCMSENMTFLPKRDLLTLEELDRLCSAFIAKGV